MMVKLSEIQLRYATLVGAREFFPSISLPRKMVSLFMRLLLTCVPCHKIFLNIENYTLSQLSLPLPIQEKNYMCVWKYGMIWNAVKISGTQTRSILGEKLKLLLQGREHTSHVPTSCRRRMSR